MATTKLVLDRQAEAQNFQFGTNSASGQALVTIENGTEGADNVVLDVKGKADIGGNAGITGDLTLGGNLNIDGAINQQSVNELNVEDRVIRVNQGGETPTDDTAGIEIKGTGANVIGALYWKDASATKFSVGDGTSQQDVVGVSATQTLTNKTLTTPTIGNFSNATHNHENASGGGQLSILNATTGTLTVARGGTGATTASVARSNLGLEIGTDVQGFDSSLADIAGISFSQGDILYHNGSNVVRLAPGTSGHFLKTNGAAANPEWAEVEASGSGTDFQEVSVSGTQDGSNKTFTLGSSIDSSDQVYLNGQLLTEGSTNDYEISGTTLTFTTSFDAPESSDVIRAFGNV